MKYMFLSFRDPEINKNLGACIIDDVDNVKDAVDKAWELDINPGGEVLGFLLTEEDFAQEDMDANKFYTTEQLDQRGYKRISEM